MTRIVIAGDRTIDWFIYSQPAADSGENWRLAPSTRKICLAGGVLLLQNMLKAALKMRNRGCVVSATPAAKADLNLVPATEIIHSVARLKQFKVDNTKHWRVSDLLGFLGPEPGNSTEENAVPDPPLANPELIVLDDHGNSFRNTKSAWSSLLSSWDGTIPIVHKMRHPLDKGQQGDALWECLESKLKSIDSPWYVLVMSADDLRETEGIQISKGMSWERTAKDLLFQLKNSPALTPLLKCPCFVVSCGWDGAIVYRRAGEHSEEYVATLHFDSEKIEGGFATETQGTMFGMNSVFVATLASRIVHANEESKDPANGAGRALTRQEMFDVVDASIPESLARARLWLTTAFGTKDAPEIKYPLSIVFPEPIPDPVPPKMAVKSSWPTLPPAAVTTEFGDLDDDVKAVLNLPDPAAAPPAKYKVVFRKPEKPKQPESPSEDMFSWTMIPPASSTTDADPAIWRIVNQEWLATSVVIAMEYVRTGEAPGLKRSPTGVFGKLKTVDRLEIESYNAIRAMVQEFLDAKARKRPYCLGVFGPPGAGKSFGVEEVVTAIGGERVTKLTFNVSQFSSEDDLVAACHRIRDKVLEGKVPFAFFDEFDSVGLDGAGLGWMRSFLALMQDGKFRDGEEMHPLGKCILIFAGGTSSSFLEFESKALGLPAALKGRDFVSRLQGYINILGPNPQAKPGGGKHSSPQKDDPSFVLRRALMLRSMLERNKDAEGLFNSRKEMRFDPGVLRALLLVPEYKHGTRSMESLLDMSQLEGQTRFDPYALPPRDQLQVHVQADDFLKLMRPRREESEEIKQFRVWLQRLGYEIREIPTGRSKEWGGTGNRPQTPLISEKEIVELSKSAHAWWRTTQKAKSIRHFTEEVPGETSPYLCDYDMLPIAIQSLIVNRVEQIPSILHDDGLEIYEAGDDWIDDEQLEELAKWNHASYQEKVKEEIKTRISAGLLPKVNINAGDFEKLSVAKRESNRDNIRTIQRKLKRVGLKLTKATGSVPTPASIKLIQDKLEDLAIVEHTRWNWQSLLQRYVYKPGVKSESRRTNPSILPWDKLPEAIRKYDYVDPTVFAFMIFQAGYDIVAIE